MKIEKPGSEVNSLPGFPFYERAILRIAGSLTGKDQNLVPVTSR
jgi:hypothetical protein